MTSTSIYKRPTCCCIRCKSEVSTSNINKHFESKLCLSGRKQGCPIPHCRFCGVDLDTVPNRASHVKWCSKNPNLEKNSHIPSNARKAITEDSRRRAGESISKAHKSGKYIGASAKAAKTRISNGNVLNKESAPDWYANLCAANRSSTHQRVCKRTHTFIDKRGRIFKFDSTWEDALANRLDELDIVWERPAPIKYEIGGKLRNYFPDFYLPEHDLYLDPKNPYAESQQQEKLKIVSSLINLIILRTLEECESFDVENPQPG